MIKECITVKNLKEVLKGIPDDANIMINSISRDSDIIPSECVEVHYSDNDNVVYFTPFIIEIDNIHDVVDLNKI